MVGYVDEFGKYRKGDQKAQGWDINPTWKDHNHDMQRREFSAQIIQPYKNGKPNPRFIRANPGVAKEYWSTEQIDKALREGAAE